MAKDPIQPTRVQPLNDHSAGAGSYVLYWMQQSQRAECNHALEHAIAQANDLDLPLLVGFGLMDGYPEANLRHYRFMVEGLQDAQQALAQRGIPFVLLHGNPDDVALDLGKDAALIVCDRGYLRHQKQWRERVAQEAEVAVVQVESDVVVPVQVASDKAEHAARTLRPKIHRHLQDYLVELPQEELKRQSQDIDIAGLDLSNLDALLDKLKLDRSVKPVPLFRGGTHEAKRILKQFLKQHFTDYDEHRNQPQTDYVSHMSKYLHFGQISPLYLALELRKAKGPDEDRDSYLEELLVRRELAQNFVHFTANYDDYNCIPEWARDTLAKHRDDERPHRYTKPQLENAETDDPYWNAAMREMRYSGYMHNYMRMYWGKKILEWCNTPEYAYRVALDLNNKYFIDGRDANSFANIAWVFGLHDRPWPERPVFGKVRTMTAGGLERKADIGAYVEKVDKLVAELA